MKGWISIHRKITENPLWLSEPFTRAQAWIDLLIIANHKDSYIYVRGNKIDIKRGQVGWSIQKLSKRWRWSVGKVNRYLNELKVDRQIDMQKNNVSSVITIVKYEDYQTNGTQTDMQTDMQTEHRQLTNNNDNNVNNDEGAEKSTPPSSFDRLDILERIKEKIPGITPSQYAKELHESNPAIVKQVISITMDFLDYGKGESLWYYQDKLINGKFSVYRKGKATVAKIIDDIIDLHNRGHILIKRAK